MADAEHMADLQYTKKELKERNPPGTETGAMPSSDGPKFPWGLTLRLEKSSLEKLGLDKNLPEVGVECSLSGIGRVISVSMRENAESDSQDVEIQIERLSVVPSQESVDDAAFEAGVKTGRGKNEY